MEPLSQYVIFIAGTPIHKKKSALISLFRSDAQGYMMCVCMSSGYCCTTIDMVHCKQSAGDIYMSIFHILHLLEILENKFKTIKDRERSQVHSGTNTVIILKITTMMFASNKNVKWLNFFVILCCRP